MGQHWYTREGEPMHWVTGANGNERATTLRDARKLNLYPSVSGIMDQIAKPGLDNWKQNQVFYAALTLPRPEGISDDDFLKIVRQDAAEEARQAAERGDEIHNALEELWKWKLFDIRAHPKDICEIALDAKELIIGYTDKERFIAEHTFACDEGYGGMIDLHNDDWLIDYKGKEITDEQWELYQAGKNPRIAWPNNCQQLTAYDHGIGNPGRRLVNVFIDRNIPGRVIIHEWDKETAVKEYAKFTCLLQHWQIDKGYWPGDVDV